MKRLMPKSLITFLQNNPNCSPADLLRIALLNGQTIYATSGTFDITVPIGTGGWTGGTTTFSANEFGLWFRGPITSTAGFDLNAETMDLMHVPQQGTVFPGLQIGMLQAARNGLFDGAQVDIFTVYMPIGDYGNVSYGVETKFTGTISKVQSLNRLKVVFDTADPFYLLGGDTKVPTRTFQAGCPWQFADSNCNISGGKAAFTKTFTAASGSSQYNLQTSSSLGEPDGYYNQGVVTCTNGVNGGLSATIKSQVGNNLVLMEPFLAPPAVGDTFSVIAGCDKTLGTCTKKFNNVLNYGGTDFVPPPDRAV